LSWIQHSVLLLAVTALFAGCGDSTGFRIDPLLVTDTVEVAAASLPQNAALPHGLDITGDGLGNVRGGRFPWREPEQWDFFVDVQNGQLVLIPGRGMGETNSRSALTPALTGETFTGLREAPPARAFSMENPVPMVVGQVYAARSRVLGGGTFSGDCFQYAKMQPLEVDAVLGRLRLLIVTNERCADPRLVPAD